MVSAGIAVLLSLVSGCMWIYVRLGAGLHLVIDRGAVRVGAGTSPVQSRVAALVQDGWTLWPSWRFRIEPRLVEWPLVPTAIIFGILGAWLLWLGRRPSGTCYNCGYDLHGTPDRRCSECGFRIDWRPRPWLKWTFLCAGCVLGGVSLHVMHTIRAYNVCESRWADCHSVERLRRWAYDDADGLGPRLDKYRWPESLPNDSNIGAEALYELVPQHQWPFVGDTDGDGLPELVDPGGTPLVLLTAPLTHDWVVRVDGRFITLEMPPICPGEFFIGGVPVCGWTKVNWSGIPPSTLVTGRELLP